jgi:pSer/pThr/pTyr-binding forkhead associated (FHA) protein
MFAIAVDALYTSLYRRGTTRQLAGVIVVCVISALLLLPAFVWYNVRFSAEQAALTAAEVEVVLAYVALWGWLLPLSVTTAYTLFTLPRTSTDSANMPSQYKPITQDNFTTSSVMTPDRQPDKPATPASFVFGQDTPWGWLEHRAGRFQGQRLALTRAVIKIGREEDNDIWLDDDMASRYHAELIWRQATVYVVDCGSLNGILLNGRSIGGTAPVKQGDLLEIGSHRFLFEFAERSNNPEEQDDPLSRHPRRSPITPMPASADPLPATPLSKPSAGSDISTAKTTPLTPIPLSSGTRPINGPMPLRLPSKPKKE